MIDRKFIHSNNREDGIELLQYAIDLFDKHKIQYYLDFGTLLGIMREDAFLRWDKNINISFYNEKDYPKIEKILGKIEGYSVELVSFEKIPLLKRVKYHISQFLRRRLKRRILHPLNEFTRYDKKAIRVAKITTKNKNVLMEIYFKYSFEDKLYWAAYGKEKQIPIDMLKQGFKKINFHGISCTVPVEYDKYLTYLYQDWRTPYKEWSQEDGESMLLEYRRRISGDRRFIHQKNLDAMLVLLKILIEAFDRHNVKYYLDFGTLLGAVRDNKLLEWDDDIDISLIDEGDFHKIPLILDEIKRDYGYQTDLHTFRKSMNLYAKSADKYVEPRELEFTNMDDYHVAKIRDRRIYDPSKSNIVLDIFFLKKYQEHLYWYMYGKVYRVPDQLLSDGFKKIDFYGISCSIPINYDNYLKSVFGDNWRVPNADWKEDDSPAMMESYRGHVKEDRRFFHKKNSDEMINLFKVVAKVLKKHDIKFYLDFGTLIGAGRDGKLIPWDDDMDISIIDEKDFVKMPQVVKEIKQRYLYHATLHTFKHSQEVYEASERMYVKPNKLKFTDRENIQIAIVKTNRLWRAGKGNAIIDIFCKYRYEENIYWMAFGKEYKVPSAPLDKGFQEIDFHGVTCLIPVAYDEYLTSVYGDWKTPNKVWEQEDGHAMENNYRT